MKDYSQELGVRCRYIDGFPNHFVTEDGRIFSCRTSGTSHHGLYEMSINTCRRYPRVGVGYNGESKSFMIHRLVAKYFVDGYFDGAVVNHKDANPLNNHYTNLEWCTQKHNVNESYITSGMDQVRNFKMWKIVHPDGTESEPLKGAGDIKRYIDKNNLPAKYSSMLRHKNSKGYIAIEL